MVILCDRCMREKVRFDGSLCQTCLDRRNALDVYQCVFDDCYDFVYAVVEVPFHMKPYEEVMKAERLSKPDNYNWNETYFVNTPLCKKHWDRIPAMGYPWEIKDEDSNKWQ